MRFLRFVLPCLLVGLSVQGSSVFAQSPAGAPDRVLVPIDESKLVTLKDNVFPRARTQFDLGAAPGSTPTGRMRLILQRSEAQQRALTQYLSDLQNPGSPSYHKWLTPAQYGATYGVSDTDLLRVDGWLESRGFKVEKTPAARNEIEFSGTLAQAESAFHTSIDSFSANGEVHFANLNDPQIPAALAPVIAGVGPLNDFHPKPLLVRGPDGRFDPSTGRIVPQLTLSNGSAYLLFVDPADAAIIYNTPNQLLNPGYSGTTYDGTGVNIGIVGVSDLTSADVANYRMAFLGETAGLVNLPTVVIDGNDPGINGGGDEALLDNEVAGGIAPKAKLYFYTSADSDLSSGLFNAIYRALDDNTVSILSASFSSCEAVNGTAGNHGILEAEEQAAAQGITFVVSSGDNGSAGCDNFDTESQATLGFAVNALASTPYAVAVGGTDFDVLANSFASYVNNKTSGTPPYYATALSYIPEKPWNDSTTVNTAYASNVASKNSSGVGNIVAGSGGPSSVYAKPAFQSSLTPNDGFRDLPDVALLAGNGMYDAAWVFCSDNITDGVTSDFYTECLTYGGQFNSNTLFGGIGGTSAAAPAFAGMLALVAQANGSAPGSGRLGQADNILYQLAQSKYSTVFHDVTSGNNSVQCTAGSPDCGSNLFLTGYNAGTGYDLASGLGSVNVAAMVTNWSSVSLASTTTSLNINGSTAAYTGVHGRALTFNAGVSPTTASGVVGVVDNASETNGGNQNNGQFAIPISGGAGSAAYSGLPGGSYTVWARYGGDTANASSISAPPINVTITPEASTTTLAVNAYDGATEKPISTTNIPYGSYVLADAQITGTAEGSKTQGVATGTVQFLNGSTALGSSAVSSSNEASWPPLNNTSAKLPAGSYNLIAQYSGDASYSPSSANAAFTITKAATTVTAGYEQLQVEYGTSEGIAASVSTSSTGVAPTGTFQFYVDGQPVLGPQPIYESFGYQPNNTATPYAWADAQTTYAFMPIGQHTLSATYSGDVNYTGGASSAIAVSVVQAPTILTGYGFPNPQGSPVVVDQSATGIATVFGSQYGAAPTGTVTFYDNNVALTDTVSYTSSVSPPRLSELNATTQHTFTTPGTHQITVSYSGDANYTSTTSGGVAQSLAVLGPVSVTPAGSVPITSPGQNGSTTLALTPNGGFTGTASLTCTPDPKASETTCSLTTGSTSGSTVQVTVNGTGANVTLNVTTTAAHQVATLESPAFGPISKVALAGMLLILLPVFKRHRKYFLCLIGLALALSLGACGGGGSGGGGGGGGGGGNTDPGTSTGTYNFTVTASTGSGASLITSTTEVTVTVN